MVILATRRAGTITPKCKFLSCDSRCIAGIILTLVVLYISTHSADGISDGLMMYLFSVILVLLLPGETIGTIVNLLKRKGSGQ